MPHVAINLFLTTQKTLLLDTVQDCKTHLFLNRVKKTICPTQLTNTFYRQQALVAGAPRPQPTFANHTLTHVYYACCISAVNLFSLSRIELRTEKCASHWSLFCNLKTLHTNRVGSYMN